MSGSGACREGGRFGSGASPPTPEPLIPTLLPLGRRESGAPPRSKVVDHALDLALQFLAFALEPLRVAFVAYVRIPAVLLHSADRLIGIAFELVGELTHDPYSLQG